MSKINEEFNVPFYVVEEIIEYLKEQINGINRQSKLNNINSLIALAVVNNRLTSQQATTIRKMIEK